MFNVIESYNIDAIVTVRKLAGQYKSTAVDWTFWDKEGLDKRSVTTLDYSTYGQAYQQWSNGLGVGQAEKPREVGTGLIAPNYGVLFGAMTQRFLYPAHTIQETNGLSLTHDHVIIPYDSEQVETFNMTAQIVEQDNIIAGQPSRIAYSVNLIGLLALRPAWAQVLTYFLSPSGNFARAWKNASDSMMIIGYGIGWGLVNGLGVPRVTPYPPDPKDIFRAYSPLHEVLTQ